MGIGPYGVFTDRILEGAMPTSPRVRYKGRGRTGGVEPRPYERVARGAVR